MYPFLLKTYKRFLRYLSKPDDRSFAQVGFPIKVKTFFGLLLLNIVFACVWLLVIQAFGKLNQSTLDSPFYGLTYLQSILIGVLAAPFLEELVFRLPMKYTRNYLLQFLISIVALFAPAEMKSDIYFNVRKFWKRFFWVFFYLMTTVFAFVHIFNYSDAKHLLFWSPLLTMIQFVTGLIIGFIRVRFGFRWGWCYHALYNLVFFSLAFLPHEQPKVIDFHTYLQKQTVKKDTLTFGNPTLGSYQFECDDYSLKIKKSTVKKDLYTGYYGVTPSRIYFEQCKVEMILRTLTWDSITIPDPDSLRFDIELKMKHPEKDQTKSRTILIQKFKQVLAIK
jgi:hypothetical protein